MKGELLSATGIREKRSKDEEMNAENQIQSIKEFIVK